MKLALAIASAAVVSCASAPAPVAPPPVAQAPSAPVPTWKPTPPPGPLPRQQVAPPRATRALLPEGLRVVVVEHHRRPIVTVNLVLPHGTLADPPESAGLTFMAVKLAGDFYESLGVGDDPADERSFRMRVAQMGGIAAFEVDPDFSMLRISGYASDTGQYLRMLWEAVAKPRHGHRSFNARRDAALDLIEDPESSDQEQLQRLMVEAAFGPGHAYSRSVFGTTESLNQMELQEVMEHQHVVFTPAGATLLVVGDVHADRVIAEARRAFQGWRGPSTPVPVVRPPALPGKGEPIRYVERRGASTLLTCATRPLPDVAGDNAALQVLTAMLGGGLGSRLSNTLRDDNGLTYGAGAEIVRRRQASALIACSPLQGDKAELGVRLFRGVLEGARAAPPEAEVQHAKAVRLAELDSTWDDVDSTTQAWLTALTVGDGTPRIEKERSQIEKVTPRDVQRVAQGVLALKTIRWVLSGDRSAATRAIEANGMGKLQPFQPGR